MIILIPSENAALTLRKLRPQSRRPNVSKKLRPQRRGNDIAKITTSKCGPWRYGNYDLKVEALTMRNYDLEVEALKVQGESYYLKVEALTLRKLRPQSRGPNVAGITTSK